MEKTIEFYPKKGLQVFAFLLALACMIFLVIIVFFPETVNLHRPKMSRYLFMIRVLSPVLIVVMGFAVAFTLRRLFHTGPLVGISDQALYLFQIPSTYQLTWDKIAGFQDVFADQHVFLGILLKDEVEYRNHLGWYGKMTLQWNKRRYGVPIMLATNIYKIPAAEFIQLIEDRHAKNSLKGGAGGDFWNT